MNKFYEIILSQNLWSYANFQRIKHKYFFTSKLKAQPRVLNWFKIFMLRKQNLI